MAGHSAFESFEGPVHRKGPTGVDTVVLVQPNVRPWSLVMK
jgi:hypothetical protein